MAKGGIVLFVGTKKQTQGPIATYAEACGMPYVNERWLGGMLTNFQTISHAGEADAGVRGHGEGRRLRRHAQEGGLRHRRELEKLRRNLGGIRDLDRLPDAVFVIDTKKEHIAVTEANKLGMPIVAVVDTNCDPDVITYVIPGNDDAIRSGALMCRVMAEAVIEGRCMAEHRPAPPPPPAPAPAPAAPRPRPPAAPAADGRTGRRAPPARRRRRPPTAEAPAEAPPTAAGRRAPPPHRHRPHRAADRRPADGPGRRRPPTADATRPSRRPPTEPRPTSTEEG